MGLNYDEFLKELEYKNMRKTIVDLKTKIKHLEAKIKKQDEKEANYIKYLEGKIEKCDKNIEETKKWLEVEEVYQSVKNDLRLARIVKKIYQDILERTKSRKYES